MVSRSPASGSSELAFADAGDERDRWSRPRNQKWSARSGLCQAFMPSTPRRGLLDGEVALDLRCVEEALKPFAFRGASSCWLSVVRQRCSSWCRPCQSWRESNEQLPPDSQTFSTSGPASWPGPAIEGSPAARVEGEAALLLRESASWGQLVALVVRGEGVAPGRLARRAHGP